MPKLKDTDYLTVSARIRAMENQLLNKERMERMLEARTNDEAAKVLSECGYGEFSQITPAAVEEKLALSRSALYRDLSSALPDPRLLDIFRAKYDYHNAKVLMKAEAVGVGEERLLAGGGRYDPERLREAYHKADLSDFSELFRAAVVQAKEKLAVTGDPQAADIILDKAYFAEMTDVARETESAFLQGYVKLYIDGANLRFAVRARRMGRGFDFLAQVLVPGGNVSEKAVAAANADELASLFAGGALAEAAALGARLTDAGSGQLTAFERLCDNALTSYLTGAKWISFGEEVPLGYLYAKEAEFTAVRIIMSGRLAGLESGIIRERLRDSYV